MKRIINNHTHFVYLSIIVLVTLLTRLPFLDIIPNGFNWDEAAYGYNAFSIFKTGLDEFGVKNPFFLQSFGDFKPSLLSYILAFSLNFSKPSVELFRFVTVLISLLGVLSWYGVVFKISKDKMFALLSALLLTITPWHIHYSKAVMDPIISFSFLLLGLFFWISKNKTSKILGSFFFFLSMYTYNSARFFVPLLIFIFFISDILNKNNNGYKKIYKNIKDNIIENLIPYISIAIGTLIIIFLVFFTNNGSRAKQVFFPNTAVFTNQINESIYRTTVLNVPGKRLLNNKVITFTYIFSQKYLGHFSPEYLFLGNNLGPRHGFNRHSNLLLSYLPLLIIGIVSVFLSRSRKGKIFILWLLIAPLASSITTDTPHSGRSLIMLPAIIYLTAVGFKYCLNYFNKKYQKIVFTFLYSLIIIANLGIYMNDLFIYYPEESEYAWQGQLEELSKKTYELKDSYTNVYISTNDNNFYIFYAFYNNIDPRIIQKLHQEQGDYISNIDNIYEYKKSDSLLSCLLLKKNNLLITEDKEFFKSIKPVYELYYFNRFHSQKVSYKFYDSNKISNQNFLYLNKQCEMGKNTNDQ